MTIRAIIACDRQGGIGAAGALPWPKNSEDLKYFSNQTRGEIVVMGAGTWNSKDMPIPLPGRTNAVVTSHILTISPDIIIDSHDPLTIKQSILSLAEDNPHKQVWIIGGARLFMHCLDIIEELHLTMMKSHYDCDTHIDIDQIFEQFKISEYIQNTVYDRLIMHRYTRQHNQA